MTAVGNRQTANVEKQNGQGFQPYAIVGQRVEIYLTTAKSVDRSPVARAFFLFYLTFQTLYNGRLNAVHLANGIRGLCN